MWNNAFGFRDYCWSDSANEPYLNNKEGVTFLGKTIDVNQSVILKDIDEPSWGQCTKVEISPNWYFCFANGVLNAYDVVTSKLLLVRHAGMTEIPKSKMSFVVRDDMTLYAYGGDIHTPKRQKRLTTCTKLHFAEVLGVQLILFSLIGNWSTVGDVTTAAIFLDGIVL